MRTFQRRQRRWGLAGGVVLQFRLRQGIALIVASRIVFRTENEAEVHRIAQKGHQGFGEGIDGAQAVPGDEVGGLRRLLHIRRWARLR